MWIIIFEYVTIKESDPICNVVHIIDANWRMNIIRSIGDRFVAVGCWYDVFCKVIIGLRTQVEEGDLFVCTANSDIVVVRPRRDVEIAPQCWQNSPLSSVGVDDTGGDVSASASAAQVGLSSPSLESSTWIFYVFCILRGSVYDLL